MLKENGASVESIGCDGPENCFYDAAFSEGLPSLVRGKTGVNVGGKDNPNQAALVGKCIKEEPQA